MTQPPVHRLPLALALALACQHPTTASTDSGGGSPGGVGDGGLTDGGADGGAADGGAPDGGTTDGGTADGGTADGGTADGGANEDCEWWVPDAPGTPPDQSLVGDVDILDQIAWFPNYGTREPQKTFRMDWNGDGYPELVSFGYSWSDNEGEAAALRAHTAPVLPGAVVDGTAGWCGQLLTPDERYQTSQAVLDFNEDGYDDLLNDYSSNADADPYEQGVRLLLGPQPDGSSTLAADHTWSSVKAMGVGNMKAANLLGDSTVDIIVTREPDLGPYRLSILDGARLDLDSVEDEAAVITGGNGQDGPSASSFLLVDASDLSGDGAADVLARHTKGGGYSNVYVFDGPISGEIGTDEASVMVRSDPTDSALGLKAESQHDFDGDGYLDLVLADPWDDGTVHRGRIYLLPGPLTTSGDVADLATATVEAEYGGTQFAWDMTADVDLDADGALDLAVGAHEEFTDGYADGAIYVFYGPMVGSRDSTQADARLYVGPCIDKNDPHDDYLCTTGTGIRGIGDLNNDGYDDFLSFLAYDAYGAHGMMIATFGGPR